MHTVRKTKCYAILENTIEIDEGVDEVLSYIKKQKFLGDVYVNMNQGGVSTVVTKEHIPLTLAQLEMLCRKA